MVIHRILGCRITGRALALGLAAALAIAAPPEPIKVATFDSGFGGYLTAKSIEQAAGPLMRDFDAAVTIRHYGDTRNLPYGEKTPEQLAKLTSAGVLRAFRDGADMVFIACNTASTQHAKACAAVAQAYPGQERPVLSIIDVSAQEAIRVLEPVLARRNRATLAILATPATVKAMVYPRRIARTWGAPIQEEPPEATVQPRWNKAAGATLASLAQRSVIRLPQGREVTILQMAPANWVELIELGGDAAAKDEAIRRDLALLTGMLGDGGIDAVGYFCTHYPVFHEAIRRELGTRFQGDPKAGWIAQGPLMARIFTEIAERRLQGRRRAVPLDPVLLRPLEVAARPTITLSGSNGAVTRGLAKALYPRDPAPEVAENADLQP